MTTQLWKDTGGMHCVLHRVLPEGGILILAQDVTRPEF
jgi:hypothetical protein